MTNEQLKLIKDELEFIPINSALRYLTNAYKYDKLTYEEFIILLNFIQRHKTDFKYEN